MKNIIFILFTLLMVNLFLPFNVYAQNQLKVIPEYNVCLPQQWQQNIFHNQYFTTDSIFNWQYYQFPFPYGFTDIFFIDSLYGWATYTGYGVAKTTDSGFNWDTTSFGYSNYMGGVHFINRSTGWIVGVGGTIRKTTNSGIYWINQDYEIYSGYYRKVLFFNENTGIVIGEKNGPYGYVIKTTNSGVNWNEIYLSANNPTDLDDQYWFDIHTGWICGTNNLLKTTNGGIDFVDYFANVPPTQNGTNGLLGISFINYNTGWLAAGNADHKNIYKTTNAGINWFFQDNPVAQYDYSASSHVLFMNQDTGWAAVYYLGVILATTNGGNNWVIDNIANSEFYRFSIYGDSKIWCAGAPGQIWYSLIRNPIGIQIQNKEFPGQFKLYQNFPNPFNTTTTIAFDVPRTDYLKIKIYNILGENIRTILDGQVKEGHYEINFDASNLSSGVYFYKLTSRDISISKILVVLK